MARKNNNGIKANTNSKANANSKANTSSNLVAISNISSDIMIASVINQTDLQIARESNEVENVGTTVLNPKLRDYYRNAYSKLNKLEGNVLLAKRKMIVQIMESADYKTSFANDKDFAESLGESQTAISKAKSCINTLKWLSDNNFGSDWTSSQLDEITPSLNKEMKADKAESFKTMLKGLYENGAFNGSMSSRQIRDIMSHLLDKYNELYPPQKSEDKTEDKTEDTAEDKTEDTAEDKTEDTVEDKTEDTAEDKTENRAEDKTEDKASEIYFKELEIGLTLENGMKCTLVGKSTKKSADKIYKQIRDMIQSNEVIKAELMKILKNVM